jgi:hypothetical protein
LSSYNKKIAKTNVNKYQTILELKIALLMAHKTILRKINKRLASLKIKIII